MLFNNSPLDTLPTTYKGLHAHTKDELINIIINQQDYNSKLSSSFFYSSLITLILIYIATRKLSNNNKNILYSTITALLAFILLTVGIAQELQYYL